MTANDFQSFSTVKEISDSSYGTVSVIENASKTEKYRKKTLKIDLKNTKRQQLIQRYVSTLKKMGHPGVNRVHDFWCPETATKKYSNNNSNSNCCAIISDFESFGSLEDVLKEVRAGTPPPFWGPTNKMVTVFGVASAMMYIHGARLMHRNLRPTNVLLNGRHEPKISDFYFARSEDGGQSAPESPTKDIKFSWYLAPELLERATYNNKVDVYAFAVLLFEVFAGELPSFRDADLDVGEIRAKIMRGERPEIPHVVPRVYRKLIEQCWSPNHADRPSFKVIVHTLMDPHYVLRTTDLDAYTEYTRTVIHSAFLVRDPTLDKEEKERAELHNKADNGDPEAQFQYAETSAGLASPRANQGSPSNYFKMAADAGHVNAMYTYAQILNNDGQFEEAIRYFRMAADRGHRDSMYGFALMKRNSAANKHHSQEDLEEAAKYFRMSADAGDIDAQNMIGTMLKYGEGVTKDEEEAAKYFKMAAERGDPEAQFDYAECLLVKEDFEGANRFFTLSADQGCCRALNRCADIAISKGDLATAAGFLRKSAESGNVDGQRNYAKHLMSANPEEAEKYLKLAADQGDLESQIHYASILQKSADSQEAASKYLKMAADQGDCAAQLAYASYLKELDPSNNSNSNHKDSAIIAEYFRRAADQGNPEAQDALGVMLRDGDGVPKNKSEAATLFLKAASLGNADAMANYAVLLLSYKPKPDQIAEAREYLEKSANKSSALGKAQLAAILRAENPERALQLATESASQGCAAGQFLLATMNEEKGIDFEPLLRAAAEKGNADAMFRLSEIDGNMELLKKAADRGSCKAAVRFSSYVRNEKPDEAIFYMTKAAESGDAAAEYQLALLLDSLNPEKAMELLRQSADQRYSPALNELGKRYMKQLKFEEAQKLFRTAARLKDPLGQLNYGLLYKDGSGVPCNYAKAYKYLKMSADQSFPEGQLQLAILTTNDEESNLYFKLAADSGNNEARYYYATILNEQGKMDEALKYFKAAAKSGNHEDSQFQLAVAFQNGTVGVPQNFKKALKYYRMAITHPNPKAASLFNYALMVKNGQGIEPNAIEAAKYMRLAALQGDPEAQNNYALMLKKGEGVEKNLEQAAHFFMLAAEQGNSFAQNNYGVMLKNGIGTERNTQLAYKMFRLSADQDNISGLTSVALLLKSGEDGVVQNLEEAARLFKIAADKGSSNAQLNFGQMLCNGEGVEKNVEEGLRYIRMSVENGNTNALNALGFIYKNGEGVERNPVEATKMFRLAANKGNSNGMNNYATMLRDGSGVPVDSECAIRYFEMAAEKGNAKAMNNLGILFYKGAGVPQDKEKALEYFRRGAALGYKRAIKNAQLIAEKKL